ncbi:hypothetical protein ENUP19_0233G0001 [Entamoeba nuttalli]|uniref:Uncharacterized protein n=1 Tax=Entamoeba nuttalli TaxID=412467 RepID=A0ABQ0DQF0_9EUKA
MIKTGVFELFSISLIDHNEIEVFIIPGSGEIQFMNQLISNILELNEQTIVYFINIIPQFDLYDLSNRIHNEEKFKRVKIYECYHSYDELVAILKLMEFIKDYGVVIINSITTEYKKLFNISFDHLYSSIHNLVKKNPIIYFRQNQPTKAELHYFKNSLIGFYSLINSTYNIDTYSKTHRFIIESLIIDGEYQQVLRLYGTKQVYSFECSQHDFKIIWKY